MNENNKKHARECGVAAVLAVLGENLKTPSMELKKEKLVVQSVYVSKKTFLHGFNCST